jgi:2-polyprenyl-3-methyl-5-hydroxy-6-metoxy-1,4-benzoquinol methylase
MNKTYNCPLCGSKENDLIKVIPSKWILKEYEKLCSQDFSYLFDNNKVGLYQCASCTLKYFHPKIAGDELFYSSLQKISWYYLEDKEEYRFASSFIENNYKVLDVGSGKGAFSNFVKKKNATFIGLDFSENAKKLADKNGIKIYNKSIQEYAEENPESVDLVTSFQVCEHIQDISSFIEAKIKVLKKEGKMLIAVPSDNSYLSIGINSLLNMPPHHISRWPDEVFRFIAKKYNLKLELIYHEPLQDIHVNDFLKTIFEGTFSSAAVFDSSMRRKLLNLLAVLFAKIFRKGVKKSMGINGNTVIAVFIK